MDQPIPQLPKDIAHDVFSHFSRQTAQAIFILDLKSSKILYINPAFEELCDVKQHDKAFDDITQTIHEEDRGHVLEKIKKYMKGNGSGSLEFRIKTPESFKWICLTLYSMNDERGEKIMLLGFAEDVTRRKNYESYLFKHNSKKNSILNILAHDLRGPLSNISLISEMLLEEHKKASFNDGNKLTDMIQSTCNQALQMINQYVNRELLESSGIELKKTRTEIVERILSVIDTFKASHNQLNRIFKLEAFPHDKIWMEIDDVKLLQVINNMISNAIKFTHEGGNIHIKLEEHENNLLIILQDNGIGIPDGLQPFLFDEFTKARRKGLKGEKPVGLGMAITKKMIELHGGKIWFESKEGKGTTFFIDLPKS